MEDLEKQFHTAIQMYEDKKQKFSDNPSYDNALDKDNALGVVNDILIEYHKLNRVEDAEKDELDRLNFLHERINTYWEQRTDEQRRQLHGLYVLLEEDRGLRIFRTREEAHQNSKNDIYLVKKFIFNE